MPRFIELMTTETVSMYITCKAFEIRFFFFFLIKYASHAFMYIANVLICIYIECS